MLLRARERGEGGEGRGKRGAVVQLVVAARTIDVLPFLIVLVICSW